MKLETVLLSIIRVEWCSICCAAQAVGTLKIEDKDLGIVDLRCCQSCADEQI